MITVFMVMALFLPGLVDAGDLEPSDPPGPTMHSMDEIYDKLEQLLGEPAPPAPVEKTGQTTSYWTRDDGDLEKGVVWPNPRFTDNGDGTVTDNLTRLIWLRDANRFGRKFWEGAVSACNTLSDDGSTLTDGSVAGDWCLPNVKELQSLIHFGCYYPACLPDTAGTGQWSEGNPFSGVQPYDYWSSTTYAGDTNNAWSVGMSICFVGFVNKGSGNYVWPVRSDN